MTIFGATPQQVKLAYDRRAGWRGSQCLQCEVSQHLSYSQRRSVYLLALLAGLVVLCAALLFSVHAFAQDVAVVAGHQYDQDRRITELEASQKLIWVKLGDLESENSKIIGFALGLTAIGVLFQFASLFHQRNTSNKILWALQESSQQELRKRAARGGAGENG